MKLAGPMESQPNPSRLRTTALLVGLVGGIILTRWFVRLSAGPQMPAVPVSWLDRLTLLLEPLLGSLGLLAAIGLWMQRRWGAALLTIWALLVFLQAALIALLVVALAALAWEPLTISVCVLGGLAFIAFRLVGAVWRSLPPAA